LITKLSREFNDGYRTALLDVLDTLECVKNDLQMHHKRLNQKLFEKMIDLMIEHRKEIRDGFDDGFIRYNTQDKSLEWFAPHSRKRRK
jgi:hypothetical protein